MTTTTATGQPKTEVAITPDEFMAEMTRLVRRGLAPAAAAFFDRHGPAVLDRLTEPQRTLLDALMEYADTVVELEAAPKEPLRSGMERL